MRSALEGGRNLLLRRKRVVGVSLGPAGVEGRSVVLRPGDVVLDAVDEIRLEEV